MINKLILAEAIVPHTGTKTNAMKSINLIFALITEGLKNKKEIRIAGFGKFVTKKVAARQGRNPRTGEVLQLKARTKVKFSSAGALKANVN